MKLYKICFIAIALIMLIIGVQSSSCAAKRSRCDRCFLQVNVGTSWANALRATTASCVPCLGATYDTPGYPIGGIPLPSSGPCQSNSAPPGVGLRTGSSDDEADDAGSPYEDPDPAGGFDVDPSTGAACPLTALSDTPSPSGADKLYPESKTSFKRTNKCNKCYRMTKKGAASSSSATSLSELESGVYVADEDPNVTAIIEKNTNGSMNIKSGLGCGFGAQQQWNNMTCLPGTACDIPPPDRTIDYRCLVSNLNYETVSATNQPRLTSINTPDGNYIYNYDDESGDLISVQYPGEPAPRVFMEYNDLFSAGKPSKITVCDPYDPTNVNKRYSTGYKYWYGSSGILNVIEWPGGAMSIAYYDENNRVRMVRVVDADKAYYQVGYNYIYDDNNVHTRTEITYYADPGLPYDVTGDPYYEDPTYFGFPNPDLDRVVEINYNTDGIETSKIEKWNDNGSAHWHKVEYVVDTDPNDLLVDGTSSGTFGYKTRMIESASDPQDPAIAVIKRTEDYEYYSTEKTYCLSSGAALPGSQYAFNGPDDVVYVEDATGQGVKGNGLLKRKTVTANGVSYTTTFRYAVKTVDFSGYNLPAADVPPPTNYMTDYVIFKKDYNGNVTKTVIDEYGQPVEVYAPNRDGGQTKVMSVIYHDGVSDQRLKGLPTSVTYYGVANFGSSRDFTINYDYSIGPDGSRAVTGTFNDLNGKVKTASYWASASGESAVMTDENGRNTEYAYDFLDRPLRVEFPAVDSETEAQRKTASYNYTAENLTSIADENGHSAYTSYDALGRSTGEWVDIQALARSRTGFADAKLVGYEYDDTNFGALSSETRYVEGPTGPVEKRTQYEYDGAGRLVKMIYPYNASPGDIIGSEEALYDDFGRVIATKDGSGRIIVAEYDDLDRVTSVKRGYTGDIHSPTGSPIGTTTYAYADPDGSGGSSSLSVSETIDESTGETMTSTYTFDRLGDLVTYTPGLPAGYGSISYTWDIWGQKTSMSIPTGFGTAGRKIFYGYDNWGRLAGVDDASCTATGPGTALPPLAAAGPVRFAYNEDGNRIRLINSAGETYYFVYDPTSDVPVPIYEQSRTNRYMNILDPNGLLIRRDKYADAARVASYTYHFDGRGDTLALSDANGNILSDTYTYDAWGDTTHIGSTLDNPYEYAGKFGYYTHYQEPNFGLMQLGVRYYDPTTGRFTQQDPIGDGMNWYIYAEGNPLAYIDPWGLSVGQPGFWEGIIPIWGSGRAAVDDFQNGHYFSGVLNSAVAISDVFMVKAAVTAVAKGVAKVGVRNIGSYFWKSGSHAWGTTRRWLGKMGYAQFGEHVHHFLIRQGGWLSKHLPAKIFKRVINQPWNLVSMSKEAHMALHAGRLGWVGVWRYGVGNWFKIALSQAATRGARAAAKRLHCR